MELNKLTDIKLDMLYEDYLKYLYNTAGYMLACISTEKAAACSNDDIFTRLSSAYLNLERINKERNRRLKNKDEWGNL